MPYTTDGKHFMLDALATELESGSVSLHTAYPPTDANEVSGGSYARQTPTFTAAGTEAAGQVDHDELTFDIPGGTTVSSVAYRDSNGDIQAEADVADESFNNDGTYKLTADSYLDLNG